MKKIFLLILTALAFASCTLYMDEPEDEKKGKDDNIENGDGFSAPRTDEDIITFKCYDRREVRLRPFDVQLPFDGETHGTLSKLITLHLD